MIPTLLIHDHIMVNKMAYGIHLPFSKRWIIHWGNPKRGDIIVFRYPENPEVFFVKRAIGLPGDKISLEQGQLRINGELIGLERTNPPPSGGTDDDHFDYFKEEGHWVRYRDQFGAQYGEITIPPGRIFAMGDNRDQSSDSRVWGFVPEENLIGRAWLIWLACDMTLPSAQFLCDPSTIRWNRLLNWPK